MKLRSKKGIITLIAIVIIIPLIFLFYNFINGPKLFPSDEIAHSNIERIEIQDAISSNSVVIEDKDNIKKVSSYLKKLDSSTNNISEANYNDQPTYFIYIVNDGRNGNTEITVSKNSITYRDKSKNITTQDSSPLFQFIDEVLN
jgi:hypothetical protein